ncbi:sugar kinase [Actinoalloteichus sp. GBA129-24]|uniref:sugar kinase n=1 Tax=Actinoalloteichus sp. GBA129-24 TaxID=1612551 RepID=UPI0009508983|nr:sugar kinase [Actinoalloteichus sp. GBA129-24]APU22630.1 sugar kinase, ribokinase [Actinoalloteichus sp. GBA129-24]
MPTSPPEPRAVCLGESMIVLVPDQVGPLEDSAVFHRSAGGAESNVAGTLAGLGIATSWLSRLGADGFGRYVLADIAARGVDVSGVELDPLRPTGLYVKERAAPAAGSGLDTEQAGESGGTDSGGTDSGGGRRADGDGAADGPDGVGPDRDGADTVGPDTAGPDTVGPDGVGPAADASAGDGADGPDADGPDADGPGADGRGANRRSGAGQGDVTRRRMHYYRSGSAASVMSPALLAGGPQRELLAAADLVHVTGITAGISDSAAELLFTLLRRPRTDTLVSFDLNWRPILWHDRDPATLTRLCALADIVLLGSDEAEAVLGAAEPARLREILPEPRTLVVKNDAHDAVAVDRDGAQTTVQALRVDVVDTVGAGDGFAAGYLAATLRGLPPRQSLRLGHLCAALALTVAGDHGPPPPPESVDALLTCTDQQWASIVVGADGLRTSP